MNSTSHKREFKRGTLQHLHIRLEGEFVASKIKKIPGFIYEMGANFVILHLLNDWCRRKARISGQVAIGFMKLIPAGIVIALILAHAWFLLCQNQQDQYMPALALPMYPEI